MGWQVIGVISIIICAGVFGVLLGITVTILAVSAVERWGERRPEYLRVRERPVLEREGTDDDGDV